MDKRLFFVFLPLFFLLTGCWDRVEVEERGFVIGTAVDVMKDQEEQKGDNTPFEITYQFVIPRGLAAPTQGQGGGSKAFMNLSMKGESAFEITRQMASKTSRTPYFEHQKVIVVSEDAARVPNAFGNILDLFIRDYEMRRQTKIFIAKGKAKDFLSYESPNEKMPVMNLESISENARKRAGMLKPVIIGDIHSELLGNSSFVLPGMKKDDDGIEMEGAAIFHGHNNKLTGYLNEEETKGLNMLRGEVEAGSIKTTYKEKTVVFEITDLKSDTKVDYVGKEDITFDISIQAEGNLIETFSSEDLTESKILHKLETRFEEKMKEVVGKTLKKIHEKEKVDVLNFDYLLRSKHFKEWQELKQDWDHGKNYFATSNINVNTNVVIRATGIVNESKQNEEG